jgi:hypothetical protein
MAGFAVVEWLLFAGVTLRAVLVFEEGLLPVLEPGPGNTMLPDGLVDHEDIGKVSIVVVAFVDW